MAGEHLDELNAFRFTLQEEFHPAVMDIISCYLMVVNLGNFWGTSQSTQRLKKGKRVEKGRKEEPREMQASQFNFNSQEKRKR